MRFEFHEKRRLALIEQVKSKRREIDQRRLHSHYPFNAGSDTSLQQNSARKGNRTLSELAPTEGTA